MYFALKYFQLSIVIFDRHSLDSFLQHKMTITKYIIVILFVRLWALISNTLTVLWHVYIEARIKCAFYDKVCKTLRAIIFIWDVVKLCEKFKTLHGEVLYNGFLFITATDRSGQNRNGHKPKRPQTGMSTNRNGHRPKRPQNETATKWTNTNHVIQFVDKFEVAFNDFGANFLFVFANCIHVFKFVCFKLWCIAFCFRIGFIDDLT